MGDGDIIPEFVIIVLIVLIPFPKSNRFRSASKKVVMTKVCTFQGTHMHTLYRRTIELKHSEKKKTMHAHDDSIEAMHKILCDRPLAIEYGRYRGKWA